MLEAFFQVVTQGSWLLPSYGFTTSSTDFKVIVFCTKSTDKEYRCLCEALYGPGL